MNDEKQTEEEREFYELVRTINRLKDKYLKWFATERDGKTEYCLFAAAKCGDKRLVRVWNDIKEER